MSTETDGKWIERLEIKMVWADKEEEEEEEVGGET